MNSLKKLHLKKNFEVYKRDIKVWSVISGYKPTTKLTCWTVTQESL